VAKLTTQQRKDMGADEFALPGKRFPLNDKGHDEKALQLAPRSEKAGNISKAQEQHVEAEARSKLKAMGPAKRGNRPNKATVI
jgi:hypothetical protein